MKEFEQPQHTPVKEEQIDRKEEAIVAGNLKKMQTEMVDLLLLESFGGNAGRYEIEGKTFPCAGANAHFNRLTGEIVAFGNLQDLVIQEVRQADTRHELWNLTFRVAINIGKGPVKIVEVTYENLKPFTGEENPTIEDAAKKAIEKSVQEYNTLRRLKQAK